MKRFTITVLLAALLVGCGAEQHSAQERDAHGEEIAEDFERGPHNGRMLREGDFAVELAIFETGVPPEYRVWLYEDDEPLPPNAAQVQVQLTRLDGQVDTFAFRPEGDYLRGDGVVTEPHSFDVHVTATHQGESAQWQFASYEGRTQIAAAMAETMGVRTRTAGPAVLKQQIVLSGVVQADPTRIANVRARYPGVVRAIAVRPAANVSRGTLLAEVQSNESLQNYPLTAPIAGAIVEHRAQLGAATSDEPLFTIVDISKVWVELDVFQNDIERIEEGQLVELRDLNGEHIGQGRVARIAPIALHGSQSVRARVALDNASGRVRPGQFVSGRVTVAEIDVPLAVERAAIQRFRDFDVVFEQIGEMYEVRMLELGRSDDKYIEVLSGLKPGAQYAVENSYVIKADIEKSGASHDH